MDYSSVSFDAVWETDTTKAIELRFKAIIHACIFALTSAFLLISITRTIFTNPGNIPDHKEWDMSTEGSDGQLSDPTAATSSPPDQRQANEKFSNNIIEKHT